MSAAGSSAARPGIAPWSAVLALGLALACGPGTPPEGTTRPLVDEWPSGVVRTEGTEVVRDGAWIKEGAFTFYDEDGDVTHVGHYANGLESGLWQERFADGSSGSGPYEDGRRHGRWRYLHPNGAVEQEGEFRRGERVGVWKFWSPRGEPRPDIDYDARAARR